ncbi:MAG: sulfatase-like hydrolase/transferase [Candidatus Omnitrophica bacterium]|nr:sulfatase-like hydrolase/transferase [Candidatus Omnitrophota bacterium]
MKKIFILFIIALSTVSCAKPNRPNIVLITIDALRPDHLTCYGYKRNTSPNIDQIAKEGTIFTQCISQASVTLVSVASLLTSMYPTKHGIITQHLDFQKDLLYPTIVEIFKQEGYKTAIFSSHGKLMTRWLGQVTDYSFDYKHTVENFQKFSISKADFFTQTATKWLDSGSKTPFFIWIHYNDPHVPYKPPVPYNKLYVRDKFYNPDKKVNLVDNIYGWGGISPKANIEDIRELDYYIAQYDGEIRYTDFWIGID